jgi:hypothetical protein
VVQAIPSQIKKEEIGVREQFVGDIWCQAFVLTYAGSPQAKSRIERLWGTFQDQLVSELRETKGDISKRDGPVKHSQVDFLP